MSGDSPRVLSLEAPFGPLLPLGGSVYPASYNSSPADPTQLLDLDSDTSSLYSRLAHSLHTLYTSMSSVYPANGTDCEADCHGRGECVDATCFCSVQYEGPTCEDPNIAYFASFSCIFFTIAVISLCQLVVCIRAEYRRMKHASVYGACAVTTQKLLYVITFVAAAIRGAYFSSPGNADLQLASSFFSSFYPLILSGGSLIVCFWAEAFHLRDVASERPRFLGKSFLGFVTFNIITYSLLLVEMVVVGRARDDHHRRVLSHVFNGCYAALMFITVVFFLIYGVEVYFKVRGGFVTDQLVVGTLVSRKPEPRDIEMRDMSPRHETQPETPLDQGDICEDEQLLVQGGETVVMGKGKRVMIEGGEKVVMVEKHEAEEEEDCSTASLVSRQELPALYPCSAFSPHMVRMNESLSRGIDQSQLHQSRFGLVFQACMLMMTVCFLCSDVLGGFWKSRVPLFSRNAYDIMFRVVELAVALWFPCVLWNCIAPDRLWILNPKRILRNVDIDKSKYQDCTEQQAQPEESALPPRECWICYESTSDTTTGPLIEPCLCRGDVAAVHHNCLRRWIMECSEDSVEGPHCKVCRCPYQLERSTSHWSWLSGSGIEPRTWLHTASLVTLLCASVAIGWALLQLYQKPLVRACTVGVMLILCYVCLRCVGCSSGR